MGDVPYAPGEEVLLAQQLTELPPECRFVVHVGDIQSGPKAPVTEDQYIMVANILKASPQPVFILPGDNEWNDAPNVDEAWTFWTRNFLYLDHHWKHAFKVARQSVRPENFTFVNGRVLFIGLNLVGGRVHDAEEWKTRHAQNVDWIESAFSEHGKAVDSAVVFAQALPNSTHADFMKGFTAAARTFEKPVLFVHGDGHRWLHTPQFAASNITRIQVDQGGIAPPLLVRATGDPHVPFIFDRRLTGE